MTKCIIYSRFSPRRNAAESESIETQIDLCRKYAQDHGHDIQGEYEDRAISGAEENRPGLWDAVEALRKGWILIAYKLDRLARDVYLSELIRRTVEKKGATIEIVTGCENGDSAEQKMIRQILQVFAEYERKVIGARTKAAMLRHQATGRRMSNRTPFGWTRDFDKETYAKEQKAQGIITPQAWLKPDPGEQEIIRYILELRETGLGLRGIANQLMKEGKTIRGGKVYHTTVKGILRRAGKL